MVSTSERGQYSETVVRGFWYAAQCSCFVTVIVFVIGALTVKNRWQVFPSYVAWVLSSGDILPFVVFFVSTLSRWTPHDRNTNLPSKSMTKYLFIVPHFVNLLRSQISTSLMIVGMALIPSSRLLIKTRISFNSLLPFDTMISLMLPSYNCIVFWLVFLVLTPMHSFCPPWGQTLKCLTQRRKMKMPKAIEKM